MKIKKLGVAAAAGVLAASLALFGCSSEKAEEPKADEGSAAGYELVTDGVLTVATAPEFEPYEYLDDNGEYVGMEMDLVRAVAAELGLEVEFKSLQFDGILPAIVAGGQADVAASGITVTPERAKQVDFTDTFYVDNQAIAVMKGGSITAENAEEALNSEGVVIAVQSGTTGETYILEHFPNAKVQPYGNNTDCFAAMQAGQATAVCTNLAAVQKMLAEAYTDAEIVMPAATSEDYAMAVSKDNPELTAAINEALAKLTEDGTLDELLKKWELS